MFFFAFAESVQIVPDFSLVVHVILIIVMIWILNRTFFKPINKIIRSREAGTGGRQNESEKMLVEAESKDQEYKDGLLEARNEGYELIESERSDAVEIRQQKVTEAKAEIAERTSNALEALEDETEAAKKKIDKEASKLADEISSNIIKAA